MLKKMMLILCMTSALTGCWDKVELENRGFVAAIGIDSFKEIEDAVIFQDATQDRAKRYLVSMALPTMDADAEGEDPENKSVKLAGCMTVASAMRLIDAAASQELYFGHTKLCVLGEPLLKDSTLFNEAIDALERNPEIGRKITVMANKGNAADILKGDIAGEPLIGMFVSKFYENNESVAGITFRQDLQTIIREIHLNGCTLIPRVDLNEKHVKLAGAALVQDYKMAAWLDEREIRGYLWAKGKCEDAQVTANIGKHYVPMRIERNTSQINLLNEYGQLICEITLKVQGSIEEFTESLNAEAKINELSQAYEEIIRREIEHTFSVFQKHNADVFGLRGELRKKNGPLFQQVYENWEKTYPQIKLRPLVNVNIRSTGALR